MGGHVHTRGIRGSLGGCERGNRRHFRGPLGNPAWWRPRASIWDRAAPSEAPRCATAVVFVGSWEVPRNGERADPGGTSLLSGRSRSAQLPPLSRALRKFSGVGGHAYPFWDLAAPWEVADC
eukprot:9377054-Pyramimonas_sp.AAC.1